ncbi:hypothetical protein ACFR9U_04930 [Halorientalis brevis]|uniref:Uncharacterized protein n=1 Tax=Halorientalis brevis TaxID=1126241 RepID=A0ABD6C8C8_9EURY|nr:hypothetical protein [Halorientalis brevis]
MSQQSRTDEAHTIQFGADEQVDVAELVRDGIGEELSDEQADEIVEAVGVLVAENIAANGDADVVVVGVKDLIVKHLVEGGHSDAIVERTADVVLDNLGMRSMFIRRALKRIVKGLMGQSDEVVEGVGDVIGEKLVEGDHTDALVDEVAQLVVRMAITNEYAEDFVEGTLEEGLAIIVEEEGVERIVDEVETAYAADGAA